MHTHHGAWLFDATAGKDRIVLGYDWDPLSGRRLAAPRRPFLPEGWGDPAHHHLTDTLSTLLWDHVLLTPKGSVARETLWNLACHGWANHDGHISAIVHLDLCPESAPQMRLTNEWVLGQRPARAPAPMSTSLVDQVEDQLRRERGLA